MAQLTQKLLWGRLVGLGLGLDLGVGLGFGDGVRARGLTFSCRTGQGQRSLGSKVRVETDGWMDRRQTVRGNCITFCANAVGN